MIKYFLLLTLMFVGFNAQSQVLISLLFGDKLNSDDLEFGLEGGANLSDVTGLEADKRLPTFNLGFYFDIRVKPQWYIYTGVMIKSKVGVDELTDKDLDFLQVATYPEAGSYSQVMKNFLVPILAKYKLKNRIYFEAGPQVGLAYKSWVEYQSDIDDRDARIREYNKDAINRFDVGISTGVGYTLMNNMGMTFGIKYYHGFVDVYKNKAGTKNNSVSIKFNIPIGAGKSGNKDVPLNSP